VHRATFSRKAVQLLPEGGDPHRAGRARELGGAAARVRSGPRFRRAGQPPDGRGRSTARIVPT